MIELFAITNRGLEDISSEEMGNLQGLQVSQVSYRRVGATYTGDLAPVLGLRTVDDVFLELATWDGFVRQRSALNHLTQLARTIDPSLALEAIKQIRPVTASPTFSVTANFVGKRNYSTDEIKDALAAGIRSQFGWPYVAEDESEINIRIFLDHEQAYVGMRLAAAPLHRRPYKQSNLPGSLKPTIAAAMLFTAGVGHGEDVLDPFCGAGTILVEAALSGAVAYGGDNDQRALSASRRNASQAGVSIFVGLWDARELPLESNSAPLAVTNLPWGRQVEVDRELGAFYRQVFDEINRVLTRTGQVVALTNLPHLLPIEKFREVDQTEISLFGQTAAIVKYVVD